MNIANNKSVLASDYDDMMMWGVMWGMMWGWGWECGRIVCVRLVIMLDVCADDKNCEPRRT